MNFAKMNSSPLLRQKTDDMFSVILSIFVTKKKSQNFPQMKFLDFVDIKAKIIDVDIYPDHPASTLRQREVCRQSLRTFLHIVDSCCCLWHHIIS